MNNTYNKIINLIFDDTTLYNSTDSFVKKVLTNAHNSEDVKERTESLKWVTDLLKQTCDYESKVALKEKADNVDSVDIF